MAKGGLVLEGGEADRSDRGNKSITYRMTFPVWAGPRTCPVEGCSGKASTQAEMKVNFWHRHVRDTVVILEEVNLPHPRSPLCDMLFPWKVTIQM